MQAYRVQKVHIGERHPLYGWCHQVTALANNLSNAVRFRQRQLLTASRKEEGEWTGNEKEVIQEFRGYLGEDAVIPSSPGYKTIDHSCIDRQSLSKKLKLIVAVDEKIHIGAAAQKHGSRRGAGRYSSH